MSAAAGERPVFEIALESARIACEVRVNDVPVIRLPGGRVVTQFDVNPHVITGKNTLSLIARPEQGEGDFGATAACSVTLRRRRAADAEEAEVLAALVFDGPGADVAAGFDRSPGYVTETPPVVNRMGTRGTQAFDLVTPFPPWFWLSALKIEKTEAVRAEVLAEYRRIWRLLRGRDVGALVQASALQARDYQEAYYLPTTTEANDLLGIAQVVGDPDIEVEEFPEAALNLEILGGGRLAQLCDDEGRSPLRLRVRSVSTLAARFSAVLCRAAGGWAIAR